MFKQTETMEPATWRLEYSPNQIRVAFGIKDPEKGELYRLSDGEEEVDREVLLQWVANNFIVCLVTKSVLLKNFYSGQDSFWTWSSLSDLAFAIMVLDLYHEKWLHDYRNQKGEKKTGRVITATDNVKKSRYTVYNAALEEMVANCSEGAETWKAAFSKKFWDEYMVRKGENRLGVSGAIEETEEDSDGDIQGETPMQVVMENQVDWDVFE